jgi:hypothetical protein
VDAPYFSRLSDYAVGERAPSKKKDLQNEIQRVLFDRFFLCKLITYPWYWWYIFLF